MRVLLKCGRILFSILSYLLQPTVGPNLCAFLHVKILSKMEVLYSLKIHLHMHRVEQHPPYDTRVMDEQSLPYLLGLPTEKHPTWSQIFYQQE